MLLEHIKSPRKIAPAKLSTDAEAQIPAIFCSFILELAFKLLANYLAPVLRRREAPIVVVPTMSGAESALTLTTTPLLIEPW